MKLSPWEHLNGISLKRALHDELIVAIVFQMTCVQIFHCAHKIKDPIEENWSINDLHHNILKSWGKSTIPYFLNKVKI